MGTLQPLCSSFLSPPLPSPEHSWRRYRACLSQESYRTVIILPFFRPGSAWPRDISAIWALKISEKL